MGRHWLRAVTIAGVVALLVVACGGPPTPPPPSGLFGDDDLEAAAELQVTEPEALTSARALDLSADAGSSRRDLAPGGMLTPQQEGGDAPAKVATVERYDEEGEASEYRVIVYEDSQAPADGQIVYLGNSPIQSVAVDTEGDIVLVSVGTEADGYDVYVFDIAGVLGTAETVYRAPDRSDEESDVSMSLDGTIWMHSGVDVDGLGTSVLYFFDPADGEVFRGEFHITLGGTRYEMKDPALSGDGNSFVFVMDTVEAFGYEMIVIFETFGTGGSIGWEGVPDLTTALRDPSLSNDGSVLLFEEIFDGDEFISVYDILLDVYEDVAVNAGQDIVDHPHLSGGADAVVYSVDGVVKRAAIEFTDEGLTVDPVDVEPSAEGAVGLAPYIARTPPPPPPPPPGTEVYDGTTVGGPMWDRPDGEATVGPMPYHAHEFTAADAGVYDIRSEQDYDGYLVLYEAPFDPEAPFTNLVASNDDDPSSGFSRIVRFLEAGEYVLVTTSCGEDGSPVCGPHSGSFENMIIPPQVPAEDEAPRIDIFNVDLSIAGTNEDLTASWYIVSAHDITCSLDWGDGVSEDVPCVSEVFGSATHSYADGGPMVVTLTATNDNGSTTAKAFPTIHDDDPANFDIVVVFANDLLTATQRTAFQDAADRWAEVITGDLPAALPGQIPADYSCFGEPPFNGPIDDVVISAAGEPIDGSGSTLAFAGPCQFRSPGTNGDLYPLPFYGIMVFDTADLVDLENEGGLFSTILHEMGHVLGVGTLWAANDQLDYAPAGNCSSITSFTSPPVFTGDEATTQHELLGGTGGPLVEDEYGAGTKCSHWDEEAYVNELMTGFIDVGVEEPLSAFTVGSLEDIGYEVDIGAADPYTIPVERLAPAAKRDGHDIAGIFGKHHNGIVREFDSW